MLSTYFGCVFFDCLLIFYIFKLQHVRKQCSLWKHNLPKAGILQRNNNKAYIMPGNNLNEIDYVFIIPNTIKSTYVKFLIN